MDTPAPGTGGTPSTENPYVITPTNLGEPPADPAVPDANYEVALPTGVTVPPPKNVTQDGLPTEPFQYFLQGGQPAGAMYTDPQYQVGTDEYIVRTKSQGYRNLNRWLFQSATDSVKAYDPNNPAGKLPDVASYQIGNAVISKDFEKFVTNIQSTLPEGQNSPEDAAWYILNVEQPRTDHDASYIYNKIRPLVKTLTDRGRNIYDLTETQIISMAQTAGVDPYIIQRLAAEQTEKSVRQRTKTSTMTKLRGLVDSLDPRSRQGQLVASRPEEYLFPLEGLAKRDAWLAFVDWKDRHGEGFLRGVTEGVSHLIVEAGYGIGGFAEGVVGSAATFVSAGNMVLENGRVVLSDEWMQRTEQERDEANQVLIRADQYAREFGDRYVAAADKPGKQAAMIRYEFGEFANPDVISTFERLKQLRAAGAYRQQMSAERLANFGEGVIKAVPNLITFFTDSVDPNSFLFRSEVNMKNGSIMGSDPVVGPLWHAFVSGASAYHDMTGADLDESIRIWEDNYNSAAVKSDPLVARMYDAIGFKEAGRAARNMMQETRLQNAAGLADPITLTLGSLKLFGVIGKEAEAVAIAQKYTKELKAVASEISAARTAAGVTSPAFDTAVASLKAKLETLYPGAKMTNDDVIGIVLSSGRSGVIADTAAARVIRRDIGRAIGKEKDLAKRISAVQEALDAIPDAATGAAPAAINATRQRLVAGAGLTAAGVSAEAVGGSINWIGEFLESARKGGAIEGNIVKRGVHKLVQFGLKQPILAGAASAVTSGAVAALVAQADFATAGIAALAGVTPTVLVRAEFLTALGTNVSQYGRIQKALGATTTEGSRYGSSIFVRTAIDLENKAVGLAEKVAAGDVAAKAQMAQLVDDATWLRRAHKSGIEDLVRNSSRVVFQDGVVGGGVGGLMAWMNDRDSFGAGVGMGSSISGMIRAGNRLYSMLPSGKQPVLDKVVLADLATMLEMPSERSGIDPASRARVFEYLEGSSQLHPDDPVAASREYIKRANIVRDLVITHQGKVTFVDSASFEASLVLTESTAAESANIAREARKRFPDDPGKAADYARTLQERALSVRQARDTATTLTNDILIQEQKLSKRKTQIANGKAEIVKLEAEVKRLENEARFADYGVSNPKIVEAANVKLQRALEAQSRLEAESGLLEAEIGQLKTSRDKAQADAGNPAPLRPYQSRPTTSGNRARKVANGYYIVDGQQGGRTYIDVNAIDNLGAISEGWHALLQDSAVQHLMPDMVRMMFGDEVAQSGAGRTVAVDKGVTMALIEAYAADLPPAQKAQFLAEFQNGKDLANQTKGADLSGLYGVTQEVLTWYMATIDGNKRTAYRPGLATPEGAEASASRKPGEPGTPGKGVGAAISESGRGKPSTPIGWSELRKILFGDRQVSDEVARAARFMFDPDSGMFARRSAEHMKAQLERSGMKFIMGGDGTFRGYFLNNKNEIIRNPVLNEFYDRVIALTNGKQNRRTAPVNLYDTLVPIEQRIDIVKANGMDWMLTPDGKGILPPERIAQVSDAFTRDLVNSLAAIPENERGLITYQDPANPQNTTITGVPSDADIAAVANNTALPQTVRENLLMIMESMAGGESMETLVFDYNNIFSVNPEAITERRLRIPKDIEGKLAMRRANPMGIKIEDAPVYGKDGRVVRIDDPSKPGAKKNLTQKVIKIQWFGADEFVRSSNRFFEEGLWYRDKEGKKTSRIKDPKGIDYTPEYLINLFGSKEEFQSKAVIYLNNHWKSGPINPYDSTPTRISSPDSATLLDPQNPERGAAMRDAMRVFFGTEPGNKRAPWVQANVDTNVVGGFAVRGDEFALWDGRLDQVGKIRKTGEKAFMTQRAWTSSSYAMSPKDWGKINVPQSNGVSQMIITATTVLGRERGKVEGINVEKVMTHPVLTEVKLFVGNKDGSKQYAYTMGDGDIRHITAKNQTEALEVVRKAIGSEIEANLWMRQVMADQVAQNSVAASGPVTLQPTIPVVPKGKPPVTPMSPQESLRVATETVEAGTNVKKFSFLDRSEPDAKFVSDGSMIILDDAMSDAVVADKAAATGGKKETFPPNGEKKPLSADAVSSLFKTEAKTNRSRYVKLDETTRVDGTVHTRTRNASNGRVVVEDVSLVRVAAPDGSSAIFDARKYKFALSLVDQNKADIYFSTYDSKSGTGTSRLLLVRKGEKIRADGSNVLGMVQGSYLSDAFPKIGKAKAPAPEKQVTMTPTEVKKANIPFKELEINRHAWKDDAQMTAIGYVDATDSHFETTEFGLNYQAHGMIRSIEPNATIREVIKLFTNGINPNKPFHTAPYRMPSNISSETRAGVGAGLGTSGGEAFKDGAITLVGKSGPRGADINTIRDIGFVVVNDGAFKDPDAAVTLLRDRLPKSVQVFKMSEEAKFLVKHREPGSFDITPGKAETTQKTPVLMTADEAMPPGATKQERAQMNRERDQVVAALREEDPAVIEEERKRIQGQRILARLEQRRQDAANLAEARGRELLTEQAQERKTQTASEEGWESFAAGHDKRQKAQAKKEAARIARLERVFDEAEKAIMIQEQQRAAEIKKFYDAQAKKDAAAAKEAQKAAERLDAVITARKRALASAVEKVTEKQEGQAVRRAKGIQDLVDEFFASNEPAVAPDLLRISSDQLLTTIHRVVYDPATGIAYSPYTKAPLVGMPARPGTFADPILTSVFNVADRAYPLVPDVTLPINGPEWTKFNEEVVIWRRARDAKAQSKFEAAFPNRSKANPAIERANEVPARAQGILNEIEDKIWITEGGVRLVREFKKATAAEKGKLQYRVYGANGMQIYAGDNAEEARQAGERLELETRYGPAPGKRKKAGLPPNEPERSTEIYNRAAAAAAAQDFKPANAEDEQQVRQKEQELRGAVKRYNR